MPKVKVYTTHSSPSTELITGTSRLVQLVNTSEFCSMTFMPSTFSITGIKSSRMPKTISEASSASKRPLRTDSV